MAVHLTVSVGWIGAVVCYLGLGVLAVTTEDPAAIRSAWISLEFLGWVVIVPLATTAFISGVVMALGTKWGLFRHYWVVISLVGTALSTVVLVLHMPTVSATVKVARSADRATLESLGGDLLHPGLGLLVLLFVHGLNIYKPKGLTKYGWRMQQGNPARGDGPEAA